MTLLLNRSEEGATQVAETTGSDSLALRSCNYTICNSPITLTHSENGEMLSSIADTLKMAWRTVTAIGNANSDATSYAEAACCSL